MKTKRSGKLLSRGLAVLLLVSFFVGCGQVRAEKKPVNTAYNYRDLVVQKNLDDYNPASEATVTVNGVTYTGTYAETTQPFLQQCNSDVYHTYKGDGFSFSIGADDKKFQELTLHTEKQDTCTFNKLECRKVADAIADDYISLDEYTVSYVAYDEHYHYFEYCREVSGFKTFDRMLVGFDCNGDLKQVVLYLLGAFENVKSVKISEQIAQKALEESSRKNYLENYPDSGKADLIRVQIDSAEYLTMTDAQQCALRVFFQSGLTTEYGEDGDIGGYILTAFVIADHTKRNWFKP